MNDLEYKLEQYYNQNSLYYYEPITFTHAYQYMLDALRAFDPIPESGKAQEVPEITDEEIARYYE